MADPYQDKVREFHALMGVPVNDRATVVDAEIRELRVRLMLEEVLEFAEASGVQVEMEGFVVGSFRDFEFRSVLLEGVEPDLAAMAQEAADVAYVTFGAAVTFGLPLGAVFNEVHAANMRKVWPDGTVHRRADGKVLKPEGWVGPDVGAVLVRAARGSCEHDVQPNAGSEHWGWCPKCGETGFPLTDEAAYGEVKCSACKDTGLVPRLFEEPGALFADARCESAGCDAGEDVRRVTSVVTLSGVASTAEARDPGRWPPGCERLYAPSEDKGVNAGHTLPGKDGVP